MIFERLCDFVADIFQTEKDSLDRETSFAEDLGAVEEDFLEIIMILEEEFDILFSMDELSEIETVGELSDKIEARTFDR